MLVNNRLSAACYRTQTLTSMMAKSRFFGQDIFVIDTSGDMAGDTRGTKLLHLLLTIAQHPQGGSKLHVLLEERLEGAFGLFMCVSHITPQPQRQVFAQL